MTKFTNEATDEKKTTLIEEIFTQIWQAIRNRNDKLDINSSL